MELCWFIFDNVVCEWLFQVDQHRELLRPQTETLKLCAAQNISLCGHRDDGKLGDDAIQPLNNGNYRHLLRFQVTSSLCLSAFVSVQSATDLYIHTRHDGQSLSELIMNTLAMIGIDIQDCIS